MSTAAIASPYRNRQCRSPSTMIWATRRNLRGADLTASAKGPRDGDDLFFIERGGSVWACWLSGKPAVEIGSRAEFQAALDEFRIDTPPPAIEAGPSISAQPQPPLSPPQATRLANERVEPRFDVSIVGKTFAAGGSREVTIFDLSEKGCRFDDYSGRIPRVGTHLTIRIGSVGPSAAIVRWQRGNAAGIQFETPLHPSVLAHIRQQFSMRR